MNESGAVRLFSFLEGNAARSAAFWLLTGRSAQLVRERDSSKPESRLYDARHAPRCRSNACRVAQGREDCLARGRRGIASRFDDPRPAAIGESLVPAASLVMDSGSSARRLCRLVESFPSFADSRMCSGTALEIVRNGVSAHAREFNLRSSERAEIRGFFRIDRPQSHVFPVHKSGTSWLKERKRAWN